MLRGIFEPFGRVNSAMYFFPNFILYYDLVFIHVDVSFFTQIDSIQLMMDSETGRSKGYGFITVSCVVELCWCRISDITRQVVGVKLQKQLCIFSRAYCFPLSPQFSDAECAKKALEQLNGFELAGRPMKVGHVTERTDASTASSFLDNDELERTGIDLGTTGRLQLMARLAEGKDVLFDLLYNFHTVMKWIMSCGIFLQGLKILDFLSVRYWYADPTCCSTGPSDEWLHGSHGCSYWSVPWLLGSVDAPLIRPMGFSINIHLFSFSCYEPWIEF